MRVNFGKFKGYHIHDLPSYYLSWLICYCKYRPMELSAAKKEFIRRGGSLPDLYFERLKLERLGVFTTDGRVNPRQYHQYRKAYTSVLLRGIHEETDDILFEATV